MLHYLNPLKKIVKAFINDGKRKVWHQYFPVKPTVINLLANDICNSKCKMCMIWKQKQGKELTPSELAQVLRDPLFSEIQSVGVTGGEPTLRKDLPLLFDAICKSLPNLRSASSITNAINQQHVIERMTESAEVCKNHSVGFGFMVSLDGVGDVHDRQRGRNGNFDSALNVIRHFRDHTDIPVSAGCTITKENVWGVDELLEFCQSEKIYIRFRVAEFINRLHNENETLIIRNFTEIESYHLALFFQKLELHYEKSEMVRRTYRNIRQMLLGEAGRTIGCPYQSHAIVLDARGDLQYCAPKSKVIGGALQKSASILWKENLQERRRILDESCNDCIHDYHAIITSAELLSEYGESLFKRFSRLDYAMRVADLIEK